MFQLRLKQTKPEEFIYASSLYFFSLDNTCMNVSLMSDEKGIYLSTFCNLGTGEVSMVLGCFGRGVLNDYGVLSPVLMIFHKLTGPRNDEVHPRGRVRRMERWRSRESEAALTSVLKSACRRKQSDWFRLISQQPCDSAAEEARVQLHFLLCCHLITGQHQTDDEQLINTTLPPHKHTQMKTGHQCSCLSAFCVCIIM